MKLTARAQPAPGFLTVDGPSGGQAVDVYVDVHTRITGLSRHGLPYIGKGQRVRIDAVRCGRELLARRIAAPGPIVPLTTAEDVLGAGWRGGPSLETSVRRHGGWAAAAAVVIGAIASDVVIARRRPGDARRG